MADSSNQLSRCDLKLDRAKRDFTTLQAEVGHLLQRQPIRLPVEVEPDTGHTVVRVQVVEQPPERWATEVGLIAYGLRSALDHLVYKLARLGPNPPGARTGFPIFDSPGKFKKFGPTLLEGVRPEHRAEIESLQPYLSGTEMLLWLEALSKADKHNEGIGIFVNSSASQILSTLSLEPGEDALIEFRGPGRVEDGTELIRASHSAGKPNMPVDSRFLVAIVFGKGNWMTSDIRELGFYVEGIINRFRLAFA